MAMGGPGSSLPVKNGLNIADDPDLDDFADEDYS